VVVEGPVVASRRQGVADELMGTIGGGTGQQERRRGSPRAAVDCEVVWRRAAVSSPEGGSAATPASSWSCEGGRER
jgi:hypothetical protein